MLIIAIEVDNDRRWMRNKLINKVYGKIYFGRHEASSCLKVDYDLIKSSCKSHRKSFKQKLEDLDFWKMCCCFFLKLELGTFLEITGDQKNGGKKLQKVEEEYNENISIIDIDKLNKTEILVSKVNERYVLFYTCPYRFENNEDGCINHWEERYGLLPFNKYNMT